MNLVRPSVTIGVDQQASARQKNALQADYVKQEGSLTTRSRLSLTLVAVADGEGMNAPERAAQLAVQVAFQTCERSDERSVGVILQQAMQAANASLCNHLPGSLAALTLAAIHGNRLYCVHAGGQTRAYLVHDGKAKRIGESMAALLGQGTALPVERLVVSGEILKGGDQVVACTDGLFSLVTEKELALIERYPAPLEAARHLSSLSMGRNVEDNVSVAVVQYGRKAGLRRPFLLAIAGAALTFVVIFGLSTIISKMNEKPPENGQACWSGGELTMTDPQTSQPTSAAGLCVPAGWDIQAVTNSQLGLSLRDENQTEIPGIDIYLSESTQIRMATIDLSKVYKNGKQADPKFLDLTEIRLDSGAILLKSDGNRRYVVLVGKDVQAILPLSHVDSILGVLWDGEQLKIDCLQGNCDWAYKNKQNQPQSIPASNSVIINTTAPQNTPGVGTPDEGFWDALCSKCLPMPDQ